MVALLAVTACGGGGTTPLTKPAPAPTSATNAVAIAHGTLTIAYPAGYHRAVASSRLVAASRAAAAKRRMPAFVDPSSGNVLDVYIDGVLAKNLDGVTPSDSATVVASTDGTQTLNNVPLFSTSSDIAVIEWHGSQILALGEEPSVSVAQGGSVSLTVTMQMNATGYAIAATSAGTYAQLMQGQVTYLGAAGSLTPAYIYATDPLGGYTTTTPASGYGGVPGTPTLDIVASSAGSNIGLEPLGNYQLTYGSNSGSVQFAVAASNPAYFYNNSSSYPELNTLWEDNTVSFSTIGNAYDSAQVVLEPLAQSHATSTQSISCAYPNCQVPLPAITGAVPGDYGGTLIYAYPYYYPFQESLQFSTADYGTVTPPIAGEGNVYAVISDQNQTTTLEYFSQSPSQLASLSIPTLPATPVTIREYYVSSGGTVTPICTPNYPTNTIVVTPSAAGGTISFTSPFDPAFGYASATSGCENYWASSTGVGFGYDTSLWITVTDN